MGTIYSDELQQMRDEMTALKSLLSEQQIVNDQLMRRAMATDLTKERKSIWRTVILAVLATPVYMFLLPRLGVPMWFVALTALFFLAAICASVYSVRCYMSQNVMTADLMTVASGIVAYKRFGNNWLKVSIPFLIIWLVCLFYYASQQMEGDKLTGFFWGGVVGGIIGGVCGVIYLWQSRKRLNKVLRQIDELKKH